MTRKQPKDNGLAGPLDIAARTLTGDLRDQMLELVRDLREPFHAIGERQQKFYAERVEHICEAVVARAVRLIAAHDFPVISATLKEAKIKDGIEAKVGLGRYDDNRHLLFDAQGSKILVVLADPAAFHGARGAAKIDADEPVLPLPDDGDDDGPAIITVDQLPPPQSLLPPPNGEAR